MRIFMILFIVLPGLLCAAWFDFLPTEVTDPDGQIHYLYATGDEFANHLHDTEGFSVIASKIDGYHYYAELDAGEPVASVYRVGSIDPRAVGLVPHISISREEYNKRVAQNQTRKNESVSTDFRAMLTNINIFIRFSDQTEFEEPRSFYEHQFNAPYPEASLRSYFQQTSYGNMAVNTYHFPICDPNTNLSYQDTNPRAYYLPYHEITNPIGFPEGEIGMRLDTLLSNAVLYIRPQVPTTINLDMNGDGYVDNISFIIRGPHSAWSGGLWAHASHLDDLSINGVPASRYTFQPQPQSTVRTLTHEMFHVIGAPDLYHFSFDGITPVGAWDLMESGTGHMGAHMKRKYGNWITNIPTLTVAGTYTLLPITSPVNNSYRINIADNDNDYFVLEYRKKNSDLFEQNIPGSGLLIYRIRHGIYGNSFSTHDEVYIYRPDGTATVNGLIASAAFNGMDNGDSFNAATNPNCWLPGGSLADLNIHSIQVLDNGVSFYYDP
ncbi:MAG: M6 family metalloprotease domain-containing protein, partial [Candidatus Cloacimonadaceae bacterium]|nr:M6 family metalloprotease domain-containing protein [Candidatus Cloacimonadaceae bacterium]